MKKRLLIFPIAGLCFALFLAAAVNYSGHWTAYAACTLIFFALIGSGLSSRASYGYLYLTVFLWLGFWFKLTLHLLFSSSYVEPVGQFIAAPGAWDNVLWVSAVAALGVLAGGLLYKSLDSAHQPDLARDAEKIAGMPIWYPSTRKVLWVAGISVAVIVTAINVVYGIQQLGLAPRTILRWPGNAAVAWMVNIGCAMMLATLAWWEFVYRGKIIIWAVLATMAEALISSVSILSRSAYLFHTLPQVIAVYRCQRGFGGKLSITSWLVIAAVLMGLLAVSIAGVSTIRSYLYPHQGGFTTASQIRLTRIEVLEGGIGHVRKLIAQGEPRQAELQGLLDEKAELERLESIHAAEGNAVPQQGNSASAVVLKATPVAARHSALDAPPNIKSSLWDEFKTQLDGGALKTIFALSGDRWIGLEGVMAVSAYPQKGMDTLLKGLFEKREIGKPTFYQYICNSSYRWTDANTWQFASLPGAAAFFYYSGSLVVVFLGLMLLTMLLMLGERIVFMATANPLLCSLLGLAMANSIAQFGITPRQDIPYYVLIFGGVMAIGLLRSNWLAGRLKLFITAKCNPAE